MSDAREKLIDALNLDFEWIGNATAVVDALDAYLDARTPTPASAPAEPAHADGAAECTCVGGSWCAIHGNCTCTDQQRTGIEPHADDCPLHGQPAAPSVEPGTEEREALQRIVRESPDSVPDICRWCCAEFGNHDDDCPVTIARAALRAHPGQREP